VIPYFTVTGGIFLAFLFPYLDAAVNLCVLTLPTLLALTALVIDGVLVALVRSELHNLDAAVTTRPG
jgi:hypothetical protein